jgi:hypothetical protein
VPPARASRSETGEDDHRRKQAAARPTWRAAQLRMLAAPPMDRQMISRALSSMSAMMSNALANTNARLGADVVPGWRYTPRKCLIFLAVVTA